MKNFILIACNLLILNSALFSQQTISAEQLLPKEIASYTPGMSFSDFIENFKTIAPDEEAFSFRHEVTIPINKEGINLVTLYFDKDATQPLYEYIIEYNSEENLDAFTSGKYGKHNENQEWQWKLNNGTPVKAWIFDTSLVIAIIYPNTEWDNE